MKIVNWVHRSFHHKGAPKDGVAGNGENEQGGNNDNDTQGFFSHVSIVDGIDHGWRYGILTIGTFGFDPLKSFNNQNDYTVLENEDVKESQDQHLDNDEGTHNVCEELNPLMFTTFGHIFGDMGSISDAIVEEPNVILSAIGEVDVTPFEVCNEISVEDDHDSESELLKSKSERTTLADLFMADGHDFQAALDSSKVEQQELNKKKMSPTRIRNGGMGFSKKLIPNVKEESSPMKNVQRLMRRMLKRKIHPADLEVKKPTTTEVELTSVETDASESVSLLPIQGATFVH